MNHLFRLVWNDSLRSYVVAPETAKSRTKRGGSRVCKSILSSVLGGAALVSGSTLVAADVVSADASAIVYDAANGVPVVDISNPNARGLSHNKFTTYNVDTRGLVLNNNATAEALQSQLAGQVLTNLNLTDSAAIILNEVVAANRSTLAGYTEVVGLAADVVVANPWGITCAGCGFINVDRVSLTTGIPTITNGALQGFNVQQGSVLINGSGADLTAQQMFDVVARSIEVQGQVNANDLKLVAGSNDWDYSTRDYTARSATALASGSDTIEYAIDSSMLGGMYAGSIQLISTEVGVGVRMLGEAAATADNFTLTADGRIEIRSQVSAQNSIALSSLSSPAETDASAIELIDATLTAEQDITLAAESGELQLTGGVIRAGNNLDVVVASLSDQATATALADNNKRYAGNTINLAVTEAVTIDQVSYGAGNSIDGTVGALDLLGDSTTLYTEFGSLSLSAAGAIKLNNAAIISAAGITLVADQGDISITEGADQAVQATAGDVSITAANGLDNAGTISAETGTVSVAVDEALTNSGNVYGGAGVQISGATTMAAGSVINSGLIITSNLAQQAGSISANSLENTGTIQSAGNLTLTVQTTVNNSGDGINTGILQSEAAITLVADTLNNSGFLLTSNAAGQASTVTVTNLINTGIVESAGSLQLDVSGDLDNTNRVLIEEDLLINTGDLQTVAGSEIIAGNLMLDVSSLSNAGMLQGTDSSSLTVLATLTNETSGELRLSGVDGSAIVNAGELNNTGIIQSTASLDITVNGALSNTGNGTDTGVLQGEAATTISAGSIVNSGLLVASNAVGQTGQINADTLANTGAGVLQSAGNLMLSLQDSLVNENQLLAEQNLTIESTDAAITLSINNQPLAIIQTDGTLSISGQGGTNNVVLDNYQATVAGAILDLALQGLNNEGVIQASDSSALTVAGLLANTSDAELLLSGVGGSASVTAMELNNAGILSSSGDLDVVVDTALTNNGNGVDNGIIQGAAATTLTANTLNNAGSIKSADSMTLNIQDTLNNNSLLFAEQDLTIRGRTFGTVLGVSNYSSAIIQSNAGLAISGHGGSTDATLYNVQLILGATLDFDVDTIYSDGTIQSRSGSSRIDVATTLDSPGGNLLFAMDAQNQGDATLTIGSAFTNSGVLHSNGDLTLRAPTIVNSAGMSALGTLDAVASGNFTNDSGSVLFARQQLIAGSGTNVGSVFRNRGTLETQGTMTLSAYTFKNHFEIFADQDITINATANFANEWHPDDEPAIRALTPYTEIRFSGVDYRDLTDALFILLPGNELNVEESCTVCDPNTIDIYFEKVIYGEELVDATFTAPAARPQILSDQNITITYGQSGLNYGTGIISAAQNLNIIGTSGAAFRNEVFALRSQEATRKFGTIFYGSFLGTDVTRYYYADYPLHYKNPPSLSGSSISWFNQDDWVEADSLAEAREDAWQTFTGGISVGDIRYDEALADSFTYTPLTSVTLAAGGDFNVQGGGFTNSGTNDAPVSFSAPSGVSGTGDSALASTDGAATANVFELAVLAVSNATRSGLAELNDLASNVLSLSDLNIDLPDNPFGYFVLSQDPESTYLIETNPLFAVGTTFAGSNYLAERYGYEPDVTEKRVGDANYEAYLIQQQLIEETGRNLLAGYTSEVDLVRSLIEQGADEAKRLDMQWGEAPTVEQQRDLQEDIVWMVEATVGGQTVIVPQVFLSSATRNSIQNGAVIVASNITMDVDDFSNIGGSISATGLLDIESIGDITNTSGSIRGGGVSLTSTEGSIVNQTSTKGSGNTKTYETTVGKTASIESTGDLTLDAAKAITVLGANVDAAGDATLAAGEDITFDTIVDKTATSETIYSGVESQSTTTTETNIGSSLGVGGKLTISSGGDTTIAGSEVDVKGDLDATNIGGDFNIEARQDKVTTKSESNRSGFGVGGGFVGSEKVTTETFTGTNAGSTLNVGGDANIDAGGTLKVQGSDVTIGGDATVNATEGIKILDGLDEERKTVVTETTTYLKTGGDSGSSSDSASGSEKSGSEASAEASAQANAESANDFKITETTVTTQKDGSTTSVGSNFNVGGDLTATTAGNLTVQGSTVDVKGDATLDAESIDVLTGRDTSWSETDTTRTSVGFFEESEAEAKAGAEADARVGLKGFNNTAAASAGASADAESTLTAGVRVENEFEREDTVTNTSSFIKSGGTMTITAEETATFVGAEVESGGDMVIDAKDIINKAAQDTYDKIKTTDTNTAGVYLSGSAGAEATTETNAGMGGGGAVGQAKIGGEVGAGVRYKNESTSETEGSVTNTGNTFTSGGSFTRTADNSIVDEATQVDAAGNITQSAKTITDKEVHDTTYSTSDSASHEVRIGAYADASAEANAEATIAVKGRNEVASGTGTDAGAGVKAQYEFEGSSSSAETATAVTSKFKSGGTITSTSTDKTTLVGTQFEAAEDIVLTAGEIEYKAAQDSASSSESADAVDVEAKVAVYGNAGFKGGAGYEGEDKSEESTTARTGAVTAGGNLTITTTQGDATFEGTNLEAGDNATIDSAGEVEFTAARDTANSTDSSVTVDVSVEATKAKSGKQDNERGASIGGEVGYTTTDSDTAVVGSIKSGSGGTSITSKDGDIRLEGTELDSTGLTELDAQGDVILDAAKSTSTEVGIEVAAEIGREESGSGLHQKEASQKVLSEEGMEGGIRGKGVYKDNVTATVTDINSAGGLVIKGETIKNQEAELSAGSGSPTLIGEVENTEVETRDIDLSIEGGYKSEIEETPGDNTPLKRSSGKTDLPRVD